MFNELIMKTIGREIRVKTGAWTKNQRD